MMVMKVTDVIKTNIVANDEHHNYSYVTLLLLSRKSFFPTDFIYKIIFDHI